MGAALFLPVESRGRDLMLTLLVLSTLLYSLTVAAIVLESRYWTVLLSSRAPKGRSTVDSLDLAMTQANPTVHRIPVEELQVGESFAAGGQATIYHGTYHGNPVAVKRYEYDSVYPETLDEVNNELQAHWSSQSQFTVNLLGFCVLPPAILVVLEYCELGSLHDVLARDSKLLLDGSTRLGLAIDCTEAIAAVHHRGVLLMCCSPGPCLSRVCCRAPVLCCCSCTTDLTHGDIKSLNFLCTARRPSHPMCALLADFGSARLASFGSQKSILNNKRVQSCSTQCRIAYYCCCWNHILVHWVQMKLGGWLASKEAAAPGGFSPLWAAPELFEEGTGASIAADVFASGEQSVGVCVCVCQMLM
eukprot:TRINITY_DN5102_c0_g1_i3.p1 TRINITY_DN5102_c0_g1~~TRINITY_DN5102_c0_g1_i3.p1  ORF type:complete len:360 (+),score=67.31 TRINITY_DN5102_c0_g1_i3:151-1230(+)